jgi:hypothetical protein
MSNLGGVFVRHQRRTPLRRKLTVRRWGAVALAIAAALTAAGCSSGSDNSNSKEKTTQEETATTATTTTTTTTDNAFATEGEGESEAPARPFAADSPWNTAVNHLPADPHSRRLIALAQRRQDIEYFGASGTHIVTRTITAGPYINTRRWSDTIVETSEGVPTKVVCRQQTAYCGDGGSVSVLDIPVDAHPQPQYDGWLTVLDRDSGVAYDLWRARRSPDGGVISYQFMRKWDLNGPGFLPPGTASARGSGLPLFAGVITPADIAAGRIDHALAISLPGPARNKYVQPASTTDGVGSEDSLPEGARIRLRPGVRIPRLSTGVDARATRAIIRALKLYGAIVVDRARVPTLYAQINFDWATPLRNAKGKLIYGNGRELPKALQEIAGQGVPLLRGNEVQWLRFHDFEVVKLPPELNYPSPSGEAPASSTEAP